MSERLSRARVDELATIAIDLGFATRRRMLLDGMPDRFTGDMPSAGPGGTQSDQLRRDLTFLNTAGLLNDGTDPLKRWLANAHAGAGGREEGEAFREALAELEPHERSPLYPLAGASWVPPAPLPAGWDAIVLTDARVPLRFLEHGRIAGQSVAHVAVPRYDRGALSKVWSRAAGTGWLIGPRLLITAYHLVNARRPGELAAAIDDLTRQALDARVTFGAQVTFGANEAGEPAAVLGVTELAASSAELDYVVLRLAAEPGLAPLRLAEASPDVSGDGHPPLNVIAYPPGGRKTLACRNVLAAPLRESGSDLGYWTAADLSASGAPVFDDDWQVVAMHRATAQVAAAAARGLPLTWANVGTRMTCIRQDLQQRFPGIWRSIDEAHVPPPVPGTADPGNWPLRESMDILRGHLDAVARSYDEGSDLWVWESDPIRRELARIDQLLKDIGTWLADTESSRSGLRVSLGRRHAVTDRLAQSLNNLAQAQGRGRHSMRRTEFTLAGAAVLELLGKVQEQLCSAMVSDRPSGASRS